MNSLRSCVLCVVTAALAGCHEDASFSVPLPVYAAVNWMNAVPDTGQLDIRVVDMLTNAGYFDANFRSAQNFPQGVEVGTRHIKVFMSSLNTDTAQMVFLDTTFTFVEGQRYAFYLSGPAQSPKAMIVTSTPPALGPTQFAIRVLSFAQSMAGANPAIPDTTVLPDVFMTRIAQLPSGTPQVSGAAFRQMSAYVVLDTGRYRLALAPTGTTTPLVQVPIPPGAAGSATTDPVAGSLIPGSVLTAVIVPRSPRWAATVTNGGRPTTRNTQLVTRSNDTVTVQTDSVRVLVNRRDPTDTTKRPADSTLATSGSATNVSAGDVILVLGAGQAEYNAWQVVMAAADSLFCKPTDPGDTKTKCKAPNDTATTFHRYRYRIAGTPASPATGTVQYRVYAASYTTTGDFNIPYVVFVAERRP